MKKQYDPPALEMLRLDTDAIALSGAETGDGDTGSWSDWNS